MIERKSLPPMLLQYLEYKDNYPDTLLFFQVGDFYELFFEDAKLVSRELNLTLTSRDKGENPIPMCGMPISAVESYIARLVQGGYSVAVVSQGVLPQGAKGMVPRHLERIVTPGVQLLGNEGFAHGVVSAVFSDTPTSCVVVSTDVQSGLIKVDEGVAAIELVNILERRMTKEVVWYEVMHGQQLTSRSSLVKPVESRLAVKVKWRGESYLKNGSFEYVTGFLHSTPAVRKTIRLLLNYLEEITINVVASSLTLQEGEEGERAVIDATTRSNLELESSSRTGQKEGSLWGTLDQCVTKLGSRRLRELISSPFISEIEIQDRINVVRLFTEKEQDRFALRQLLAETSEVSRIATRIALGVVSPRELSSMRSTLRVLPEITALLASLNSESSLLHRLKAGLTLPASLYIAYEEFLTDNPPPGLKEGGVVRTGFNTEVDHFRTMALGGKQWFEQFAEEERRRTGISSLKVRYNQVLGFFIDITVANATKVPPHYEQRQSTVNSRRFVVPELKEAEKEYFSAQEKMVKAELELWKFFIAERVHETPIYRVLAEALADIDMLATGAELARVNSYCEPVIEGAIINIVDGKHPVLARYLGGQFIPNSIKIGGNNAKSLIVTGPNMGGKSTYLRQAALIVIMAQIGWFVPARSATIGVVDRFFARLGASDNLLEGESTFMVEMRETSTILAQASEKSLVVMDEVGRGTSTTDGVALAQAILEWILYQSRCRCIFATHYHELCDLENDLVKNISVQAKYVEGEVVFTHRIIEGAASRSYGVEVARLAGLPRSLLERARSLIDAAELLKHKETEGSFCGALSVIDGKTAGKDPYGSETVFLRPVDPHNQIALDLTKRLQETDPSSLSPLEALKLIYELKEQFMPDLVQNT
jgi:DNA mismatch repair protein MutS